MRFSLYEVATSVKAIGDFCDFKDIEIRSIKTDSRLVERGDLFVCLVGRHFDGHSFVDEAIEKGAGAVLGEKFLDIKKVPYLLVEDSLKALGDIARLARNRFRGKVIGITGSSGKTTVKEFMASILAQRFKVGKSYKNWNNDLGVPLSVFQFNGDEDFWIVELGVSKKGDMERLASIIRPNIAVFVNVGISHTEGLGSFEGVLEEKTTLLRFLDPEGLVIYNKDIKALEEKINCEFKGGKIGFSTKSPESTRFYARYKGIEKGTRIYLSLDENEFDVQVNYVGTFMVGNVLAASTAAYLLGVDVEGIKKGIRETVLPSHRGDLKQSNNFIILDDCYNANPLSMMESIRTAYEISMEESLPLFLVLGDMKELGNRTAYEHEKLGEFVKGLSVEMVFYYGAFASDFLKGFKDKKRFVILKGKKDFLKKLETLNFEKKSIFLFKASRSCELERFVKVLMEFTK